MKLVIGWLGIYWLGIAFIACLPPWEGYDEVAHYSYAQQLADTGQAPSFTQGKLSSDAEGYRLSAPMPYVTTPPFDGNGGVTYRQWFAAAHAGPSPVHEVPAVARHYSPGTAANWQAQHPALYYRLMAPLLTMTADLSWAAQLFWLRLASWSLAFAGLVIGVMATVGAVRVLYPQVLADYWRTVAAWPLLFAGIWPEFARLGNDALVLLLLSAAWAVLVRRAMMPLSWWWYAALGILLGLGGLTKVIFLPVAAVVLAWLLWLGVQEPTARERARTWLGTLACLGLFVAISSQFYLANIAERGTLSGLVELSDAPSADPLFGLQAFAYPCQIIKGLLSLGLTFVWGASASGAYPPVIFVLPMVLLAGLVLLAALWPSSGPRALPVLAWGLLGSVLLSLFYYLLVRVASTGMGSGVPGWYLHTLLAPISLLLALGAHALRRRWTSARLLWRGCLGYALGFCLIVSWLQLSLFSGCTFKTASSRMYSSADWQCLFDVGAVFHGLAQLAYPVTGLLCLTMALVFLGIGVLLPMKFAR